MTMPHEKLTASLKKLLLAHLSLVIEKHLHQAAENNLSYEEFLNDLLDEEIAHRKQSRVKRLLKSSTITVKKTIDNFDFTYPEKINHQLIKSLFDLNFIKQKTNVILLGPPGVGNYRKFLLMERNCDKYLS